MTDGKPCCLSNDGSETADIKPVNSAQELIDATSEESPGITNRMKQFCVFFKLKFVKGAQKLGLKRK